MTKTIRLLCTAAVAFLLWSGVRSVGAQETMKEFVDKDYAYAFKYPAEWKLRKLPEGAAHKDMRVMLHGPHGSSFVVIAESLGSKTTKESFENTAERKKRVDALMAQTVDQIYKTVSRNMQATNIKVGDRVDLSNARALQFYISTLHDIPAGKSIIVAGIHALPFGKAYMLNFVMTAFWDETKTKENDLLRLVFNSFRLLDEGKPDGPAAGEKPR